MAAKTGMTMALTKGMVELGIFSFVINVLLLAQPLYMLQVYDRVLPSSSINTLLFLSIITFGALIVMALLDVLRQLYATRLAARFDVEHGAEAFLAASNGPRAELGDVQALRDLATVRNFMSSRILQSLFDLPFVPLYILLLLFIHPYLFILTVGGALLVALLAWINQRSIEGSGKTSAEASIRANAAAQSFTQSAETIRAMGMTRNVVGVWGKAQSQALVSMDENQSANAWFGGFSRGVRQLLQIAIMGVGAWLVLDGQMTAGMIFATSMISGRALQPIDQLIASWRNILDARLAWARFREASRITEQFKQEKTELPAPTGFIQAEDLVWFPPARRTGDPILKRLTFQIPAGASVGLVGPSGAGKSTLAKLLCGAIDPMQGSVRIDRADIRQWDRDRLGKYIGYLSQNAELLPGTIAQNISRFDPQANDEDIVMAAKKAQVHEMILGFPGGYGAMLGPGGLTLSGGQRQRVGLARAFYGSPKIIVLDEPNSNLDSDGDLALERAIMQAKADGATLIMVTQRKTSADKLDNLMILRNGVIEDYGPREKVIEAQNAKMREAMQRQQAAQAAARGAAPQGQVVTLAKLGGTEKLQ